ncbi:MAG: 50S ribosomal protein L3 [Myxococcales bacterium]
MRGLIGRKLGMTQLFDHEGNQVPATVIEVGPCTVVRKKTRTGKDGYNAMLLGFSDIEERKLNKPELGVFKAHGAAPKRHLHEFRLREEYVEDVSEGDELTCAMFQVGDFVDVTGTTKGRGFAGVMKRCNFKGSHNITHGTHEYMRHGGSAGSNTYPGRTMKGKGMPGQYGNARRTVQNLKVVGVVPSRNLVLVKGAIPGATSGVVYIEASHKKEGQAIKA